MGYLMLKPWLLMNNFVNMWLIAGGDKAFHTSPKDISPIVNVIARLGFELAFFDVVVQHFSYCTTSPVDTE